MRSPIVRQAVFLVKGSRSNTARVMKITSFLFFIGCFQLGARELRGQEKITINAKAASLESILKDIRKQTGYQYLFVDQWEQEAKKVDISVTNATLLEVLDLCFKDQPFSYTIVKKMIVIKKKEESKTTLAGPEATANLKIYVINEQGEPLVGASVTVKNGKIGAFTNEKGTCELKNASTDAIVSVSYTGYQNKEIPMNGKISMTVTLGIANSILDQVKVIAYGTTTQRLSTGNVSTIKSDDIERQPVTNPLAALEGRVSGMFITQQTGVTGGGFNVQIRGRSSINSQVGNDPLYLIDGVPYASTLIASIGSNIFGTSSNGNVGNPFNYINPSDIESIDILKDADATAIYGSRGANGVVLITTKKGKVGKAKVEINAYGGFGKVSHMMNWMNTKRYLLMRHEAFKNDSIIPTVNNATDLLIWDTTRYTDWQKTLIGGTANYTDSKALISGGNVNTQYTMGGSYHKETTVFPGNFTDKKGSMHFNITSITNNQKLKISLSGNYVADNNNILTTDITNFIKLAPDTPPIYNTDGSLNWSNSTWTNPFAYLNLKLKSHTNNLVSNAIFSYRLLPGLEIKASTGYSNMQMNQVSITPSTYYNPAVFNNNGQRNSSFVNNSFQSWVIEPQAIYQVNIYNGKLTTLIGSTIQQSTSQGQILNASGFNSDLLLQNVQAASSITVSSVTNLQYKYNALFGRINYNWQEKYIISLTGRRDGSSRFGPGKQFANFGAVGLGWLFSNENSIQKNLKFISFGKLRASYGSTGNDQIGDYQFLDLYNSISVPRPYQGSLGLAANRLFNSDFAWEINRKLEGGIELGVLEDRILVNASYYTNQSSNQLVGYPLSPVTGFGSITANFPATVQNNGIELSLNTINIKGKKITWSSSINLTIPKNKLISFPNLNSTSYSSNYIIGQPLNIIKVYHFIGVNDTTGIYQFSDNKGNPTYTPSVLTDRSVIINMAPKFYGGLQNTITYKGFQLDFLLQFVKQTGIDYLYNTLPGYQGFNQPVIVLNRWQKRGNITNIQKFTQTPAEVYSGYSYADLSDFIYKDASFIRLKNMSLYYNFPDKWRQRAHLQNCRLYIQGQNILTITSFNSLDPETQNPATLPPLRVLIAGIQIAL